MEPLDLKTLCDLTGVSPRTVYFYVQQGLLPPAEGAGRGARYTEVHRDRLRLIRRLQDQHLPLSEIRKQLEGLTGDELSALTAGVEAEPFPRAREMPEGSAADYIQSVLAGQRGTPSAHHSPSSAVLALRQAPPPEPPGAPAHGERSQWERIWLAPDIELHVRRPLSRVMNRKLERLLDLARALMKETS